MTKSPTRNFIFLLMLTCNALYAQTTETIYKKVMDQNLSSIPYEDDSFSDDSYREYLKHVLCTQLNMPEFRKRRALFLMLDKCAQKNNYQESPVLNDPITWKDLNLFCGQTDVTHYVAAKIDRTVTSIGKITLYSMLAQPTSDISTIEKRQRIVKELVQSPALLDELDQALTQFAAAENIFFSTWDRDQFKQAMKRRYFNFSSEKLNGLLNNSSFVLNVSSFFDHQQRLFCAGTTVFATGFLPVYAASKLMHHDIGNFFTRTGDNLRNANALLGLIGIFTQDTHLVSIMALLSAYVSFQGIKDNYEWTADNFALDSFLHIKMMYLRNAIRAVKNIERTMHAHHQLDGLLDHADAFTQLFDERDQSEEFNSLLTILQSDSFKEKPSLGANRGKMFLGYKQFYAQAEQFNPMIEAIGELDMYVSLAKLYNESVDNTARYCFATFSDQADPTIEMKAFWNPSVDPRKVVCNMLHVGFKERNNMIITGPNAGGKSTLLKAIAIAIIMAQTFGIAPAQELHFTPFDSIMTYLNITDDIGAGNSLFKAQVLRAQQILDTVSSLDKKNKKSFAVIDEMFNGTSPKEAQACAYSVAKELDKYPSNIGIIATHYQLLTELEKESKHYRNYSVGVEHTPDGKLVYPFILKRGIADQCVALDILRNEGFSGSIIELAQSILEKEKNNR